MEEKNKKLMEYNERYRFWSNQILSQFGYTQNLFITIGLGFFGYLISIRDKYPEIIIKCSLPINWNLAFYMSSFLLVFISILIGSISILSRLYDLRLTRHIISTRKEAFKERNLLFTDSFIKFDESLIFLLKSFFKIIFCKIQFIKNTEINKSAELKSEFENLRKQSKILGILSWKTHKIQIMTLIISVLIYSLTIFK